ERLFDNMMPPFCDGWTGAGHYGQYSTGIVSYADMNVNEDGYSFYDRLANEYNKWNQAADFPDVFSFKDFDLTKWNESKVGNYYPKFGYYWNKNGRITEDPNWKT